MVEWSKAKKEIKNAYAYLRQKKILNIIIIVAFLFILISSSWIRVQNLPLLKDSTSGKYLPLALDPHYFLRVAETMVKEGGLPEYDAMRAPGTNTAWTNEILPISVVTIYKITKIFNPTADLRYIHIISPVIFFILALIAFYFMSYSLTKSRLASLLASALLAFSPAFIYRTTAGFADHEAIGIFAVFLTFLVYSVGLQRFEKNWKETVLWGVLLGFFSVLTLVSWGGAITFLLLIIPSAFLLYYLLRVRSKEKAIIFYILWLIGNIIFPLFFGYPYNIMLKRFMGSYGLLVPFTFVFMLIDYALDHIKENKYFKRQCQKLYALVSAIILGLIGIILSGRNPLNMIKEIWFKLMRPFISLTSRLEFTVAENAQPFLIDWIRQVGKSMFWLFFIGVILVGIDFSKKIERKRYRLGFNFFWILFVCGILFSRISANSIFNGTNFISQLFYLAGEVGFGGYFIYIYMKKKFKAKSRDILLLSIIIFTLIYGRSATRIFFLITPFVFLVVSNLITKSFAYAQKSKDDLIKLIFWVIFALALIISLIGVYTYYASVNASVKHTGPSANVQWQEAMSWIRNNTQEKDVFVHWWDYGYWIQSMGERPTVTDGGHAAGGAGDHYIGRYVLTTPWPESALTYMKSWNVSYLLIDQTDLGKYTAYSKIGGDLEWDRFAIIPTMAVDKKQILETSNGTTRVYIGTTGVDEDITLEQNGTTIFLPGPTYDNIGQPSYKSFVIGTIINIQNEAGSGRFEQPKAVYNYNGRQVMLPVRYIYFNDEVIDFGSGVEAVIRILPSFDGQQGDNLGAAIYLSPKVQKGLFARLYLMNGVFGDYPTVKIAHAEDDYIVKALKSQGINMGEFVFYKGLRGPIKIWEVDYPDNIQVEEGFLEKREYTFGDKDYLFE